MLGRQDPSLLRDVFTTAASTSLFLVAVTVAWLVSGLIAEPQSALPVQLLGWGAAAVAGREAVQRRLGGGSLVGREGRRLAVLGGATLCAIATTGLPFLAPVVGGAVSATVAQRSPGRRSRVGGVVVIVAGTVALQLGVRAGLVPQALPAGTAGVTAAVLMFMTVVSFLHTESIAAQAAGTARALTAEQERRHAELLHAASHDALTGLASRRAMTHALSTALLAARPGAGTAVLFLDLDGFKQINDSLGHEAGDAVLVAAGQRLRAVLREGDVLARAGGDEFVAVLGDVADPAVLEAVAATVRAALLPPFDVGGTRVTVGVSVGWAHTQTPQEPAQLLREADAAMYAEKRTNRRRSRPEPATAPVPAVA